MFDLTGKTALVTGATGGIGAGVARALHAQGATVAITGRRAAELEALAAELGARVIVAPADLADPEAPAKLVEKIETEAGSLDILVNNAGFTRDMLALRMGDADWNAVLEVDLTAPFRLARAALRGMMKKRQGRIISIASIVGVTGNAGQANYAAAKAGLHGLTMTLARELAGRSITANAVAPGFITTDMTGELSEEIKQKILGVIPLGRFGSVNDIAAMVYFLASEEGGYITGQVFSVDGGMAI